MPSYRTRIIRCVGQSIVVVVLCIYWWTHSLFVFASVQLQVLCFGKNEAELFLLQEGDTDRAELVDQLKRDPLSPERWLNLVNCPVTFDATPRQIEGSQWTSTDKTPAFSSYGFALPISKSGSISCFAMRRLGVLTIATLCCRTDQETRYTFKYMKVERVGTNHPELYTAYAKFEARAGACFVAIC